MKFLPFCLLKMQQLISKQNSSSNCDKYCGTEGVTLFPAHMDKTYWSVLSTPIDGTIMRTTQYAIQNM